MSDPIVVFDQITKRYDGINTVVHGLDLTIERGEFVTLLGPSGSGKTTSLMMLAGFEEPTSGTITLDGRLLNHVPAHQRGIGVVFQNYALFPHMSVAGNLSFPLEMQGIGRAERDQRITAALDMVKLGPLGERRPSELSGGQQQRVALARALVFQPKLVLMDEPLGALDKQLREHMQIEIKHIHEQLGVTVVYVTHDQSEALTMSDRVAVFNQGRIQQLATPQDLYERPDNSFVAQFIGENNRLAGVIEDISGGRCLVRLATGEVIDATPVNVTTIGAKTVVSIRPERVEFKPEMMPAGVHTIDAEVLEFIYMGDLFRTRLRVAGSEDFVIKSRNAQGQRVLVPGEKIKVGWHPQDARALDP
jgi:putative spermidine/putrescine transport system ATP-binding protein